MKYFVSNPLFHREPVEGAKYWGYVIKLRRSTDEVCNIVLKFVKFVKMMFWTTSKERVAVIYP